MHKRYVTHLRRGKAIRTPLHTKHMGKPILSFVVPFKMLSLPLKLGLEKRWVVMIFIKYVKCVQLSKSINALIPTSLKNLISQRDYQRDRVSWQCTKIYKTKQKCVICKQLSVNTSIIIISSAYIFKRPNELCKGQRLYYYCRFYLIL